MVQQWFTTKGSYVHKNKPQSKIFGGITKMLIVCNFLETMMVSDKMIHKAFKIHKTLQTKPGESKPNREILFSLHVFTKTIHGFNLRL